MFRPFFVYRKLFIGILLSLFCLSAVASTSNPDRIYAFGDSFTDNGAGYSIMRLMQAYGVKGAVAYPSAHYWHHRWSNGPTSVEVMAKSLDLPLNDYAIGGAKSGYENYYRWLNKVRQTGTLAQINKFLNNQPKGLADTNGLYFIFASANDFLAHEDFNGKVPVSALATRAATNIEIGVERLADAGAQQFVVVGSYDLAHTPAVTKAHNGQDGTKFQQRFDTLLHQQLKALSKQKSLKIVWFDFVNFAKQIRAHPNTYGLTDLNTPCQWTYPLKGKECAEPETHFFWDQWHPTHHVHKLVGQEIAEEVQKARTSAGTTH